MRHTVSTILAVCAWLTVASCAMDSPLQSFPEQCNPLGGARCVTPIPSDLYAVDAPDSPTGIRLQVPQGALPRNIDGIPIDPVIINGQDGWSATAPIITAFPGGVDPTNLVGFRDMSASTEVTSPTLLLDLDRNRLVPHFAELDLGAADQPDHQALYIRPAHRLQPATRYAVAIQNNLHALDGGPLPVTDGFRALVAGTDTAHSRQEAVRPRYARIFAALEGHGVQRDRLVVAWDFTTASDEPMINTLLSARDDSVAAMGEIGENLSYTISEDSEVTDDRIRRAVAGTFESPLFLTDGGSYGPLTRLETGPDGTPTLQGLYDAPFTAIVPECAYEQAPVPIMVYGHGLVGTAREVTWGAIRHTSATLCMVVIATDWRGMSEADAQQIFLTLNDLNRSRDTFSVLVQGLVNFISLTQVARGPMARSLFVDDAGHSLVDPNQVYYYGLSQGGIFGTTFMAFDPFIERGVLGTGGANYSLMLERSVDWPLYATVLGAAYPNRLDMIIGMHLLQIGWDRTEAALASAHIGSIPRTPPKQVLLQIGVGDAEVTNLATYWQARTSELPVLEPTSATPWGLATSPEPLADALVIFDLGDELPVGNVPPDDNDTHDAVRLQPAALRQMAHFFDTGQILQTCQTQGGEPAPCDCTAGYCD